MTTTERAVPTPYGDGRLVVHRARRPIATLLLSHGAGNGIEARDLAALAAALPRQGVTVALFEQPWRVAGKKIASPPATLDVGLHAAARRAPRRGRRSCSAVARPVPGRPPAAPAISAPSGCWRWPSRCTRPGRPEKSRLDELTGAGVPTLVVQGERDPMGTPEEFPETTDLTVVPFADHGLRVPARAELSARPTRSTCVVEAVLEWLVREVTGNP